MRIGEIFEHCRRHGRRPLLIAAGNSAVVAVPGMEGRLFYGRGGEAVSLFRPEAAEKITTAATGYFNPGGDGLWPAPEGTRFGYEYASGAWRVPPGLTGAQYEVAALASDRFTITAEIDLVNNQQRGIPCRFTRSAQVRERADGTTVIEQRDAIEYLGKDVLHAGEFLLAPWSLSQFAVDDRSRARFCDPGIPVRDLYEPSAELLSRADGVIALRRDPARRIQLALPETAGFVELRLPDRKLAVRRTAAPLAPGLRPIDIADAPPDAPPGAPVRYSIYSDPSGFMELEAAGGCPEELVPGVVLGMEVSNIISNMEDAGYEV